VPGFRLGGVALNSRLCSLQTGEGAGRLSNFHLRHLRIWLGRPRLTTLRAAQSPQRRATSTSEDRRSLARRPPHVAVNAARCRRGSPVVSAWRGWTIASAGHRLRKASIPHVKGRLSPPKGAIRGQKLGLSVSGKRLFPPERAASAESSPGTTSAPPSAALWEAPPFSSSAEVDPG
jgi:hypothetical protein